MVNRQVQRIQSVGVAIGALCEIVRCCGISCTGNIVGISFAVAPDKLVAGAFFYRMFDHTGLERQRQPVVQRVALALLPQIAVLRNAAPIVIDRQQQLHRRKVAEVRHWNFNCDIDAFAHRDG